MLCTESFINCLISLRYNKLGIVIRFLEYYRYPYIPGPRADGITLCPLIVNTDGERLHWAHALLLCLLRNSYSDILDTVPPYISIYSEALSEALSEAPAKRSKLLTLEFIDRIEVPCCKF